MSMNIILSACLYPVMIILWIVFKVTGKDTKRYVFGVTLNKEQKASEEVKQIIKEYDKDCWIIFAATMWVPFIAFAFDRVAIPFTIWMMWFLLEIVLLMVPFVRANKKTLKYKGEVAEEEALIEYIELRSVRTIKVSELLYPILLSVIPPVYLLTASKTMNLMKYQRENYYVDGITFAVIAACTILFALIAWWMDQRRTLVINGDSDINLNYSRAIKKLWKKFWLTVAYVNAAVVVISSLGTIFELNSLLIFVILLTVETAITLIMMVRVFVKKRELESAYESKFEIPTPADQDRYWIWGMFYYNKRDKNSMVDKRFGIGTTMNMATKAGIISEVIGLLALVWIPFFCIYMIMEDYTPTHLIYKDDQVICRHLKDDYVIDKGDIVEVQVVKDLPKNRNKSFGTATDYFEKGDFRTNEDGSFKEFVVFTHDTYLKITTKDTTYYVNGDTAEETMEVYELIK